MSEFLFKRFKVRNVDSAMKVNTDGVLLGALVELSGEEKNILDIGTGTGTIALMLAQRLSEAGKREDFKITGIDIDGASAVEAGINFAESPWGKNLNSSHTALDDYVPAEKIDLIVSNPPYFDNSLTNPENRKAEARHCIGMSYKDILVFSNEYISDNGTVALILPYEEEKALRREAGSYGFCLKRITRIKTTPQKRFKRIIAEFVKSRQETEEKTLTVQDGGKYTEEYLEAVKDFYLFA